MENNIKISIPKPCHEDWNTMTPNEQGSFCGKCCKTVVDFSNKTPEEIRNTLLEKKSEKVCGRFMNEQLNEPHKKSIHLNIPYYLLPKNLSFQKAFGVALFFVFGTGLFSCVTPNNHTVGELTFIDTTKTITDSSEFTTRDTIYNVIETNDMIKGDIDIRVEEKSQKLGKVNVCEPKTNYDKMTQGEVSIEQTGKTE